MSVRILTLLPLLLFIFSSCIEKDLYRGKETNDSDDSEETISGSYEAYLYPFGNEIKNPVIEILIETNGNLDLDKVDTEIPVLKYNKSWLFLLTQDDCKHAAYSRTWAAINGRPVSGSLVLPNGSEPELYYDARQLYFGDTPPDSYLVGKTLGSTDGAGNEVRFHFSTTIASEEEWMHAKTIVDKGFTDNYYRFYMKSGLIWENVKEMLNYGTGIAFHDVLTESVNNADSIAKHYIIAQDSILKNLNGRGCKFLAEPNGNKTYITAATGYKPIQTITLQNGGIKLYPFQVKNDLAGSLIERVFYSPDENLKQNIQSLVKEKQENRGAIAIGVHGTGKDWVDFLIWLNNNFGKDGDDSVWFPNQEEYYEYNYYRIHSIITKTISGNALKITIPLPSGQYFYYPSITLNLKGLTDGNIKSIQANDAVSGLSHADYKEGTMINVDCRQFLKEHAEHYVEVYENNKSKTGLNDAIYFVNMLKDSQRKEALMERLK
ncbi:MAG: hypothetical protein PHT93_07240 [Massilibacteroides sp.]|nr:hypothetical protein [Massilibacteroides sp.]MDD4515338.1 hypothetical protein [Massilibacteroides sp.]